MIFAAIGPERMREPSIERLITSYSSMLMRLCYFYLRDYQQAEEAVQDVLFKAYSKYSLFRGASSEKTWITKIAVNICRDYLRRPSRREIPQEQLPELSPPRQESSYGGEDARELLCTVYQLPDEYRELILLRYYQDMQVKEIARALREKPNTIAVRLKRAREMLKHVLEEENEN